MLPPPSTPRANVLVIDDDPAVRDCCTTLLHALGYGARGAQDGQQALASLQDDGAQVELVLLDLELPCMQGGALLRDLKRENPNLRVLLMSGHPRNDPKRFLDKGADAVLQKPFRLGELDQSLDVALTRGAHTPAA
jgi:two-component system cell cycle sensor histidine kinase/response regulator CckA